MEIAETKPFDVQIKLLMIGDNAVGKTCILMRFANDSFQSPCLSTIGIDYKVKIVNLDDKRVKLHIWDTAGQERFRTITTSYFRGAQGILLVYDVTDRGTFNSVSNWVAQIQMHADVNVNKILVGNKTDKEDMRVVTYEEAEALAKDYNMRFFETSALENFNVDACFMSIALDVKHRMDGHDYVGGTTKNGNIIGGPNGVHRIGLAKQSGDSTGGCCR